MAFPPNTPVTVRRAVSAYRRRRFVVYLFGTLGCGLAAYVGIVVAMLIADHLLALPAWVRMLARWAPALCMGLTLAELVRTLTASLSDQQIAIRLDQALPRNADRWSTALNLATRQEAGETVGLAASVERLYAETESQTAAQPAAGLVPHGRLKLGLGLVLGLALLMGGLKLSRGHLWYGSPELLMMRLLGPGGNFPVDSRTVIEFVDFPEAASFDVNGLPVPLGELPEGEAFTLTVQTRVQGDEEQQPTPTLEWLQRDGSWVPAPLVQAGKVWSLTRPDLTEDVRLRVRAGDAVTAVYEVKVLPRIKIEELRHSVRFPSYARRPEIEDEPLTTERLALLEESRLEFTVACDRPISEISAVFELLANSSQAANAAAANPKEAWAKAQAGGNAAADADTDVGAKRRDLNPRIRRDNTATFRMKVDQPGILRVRVTGENGLPGQERVCIIEPVRDTPPRITVSGIETDTWVTPGEVVGFHYSAEDDLAVSDIIMDWTTAGSARVGDLAGEEYLKNEDFGKPIVAGEERIQRMNYKVYGTTPFEFELIVVDAKGQESRSGTYRIHLLTETHAARFDAAMRYYGTLRNTVMQYRNVLREAQGNLKILAATIGDAKTWPGEAAERPMENLQRNLGRMTGLASRERARHYFSGWPLRVQTSTALLIGMMDTLPDGRVLVAQAGALTTSTDLPKDLAALDATLTAQASEAEKLLAAIGAEAVRFQPEALLQDVRNLRQRIGRLDVMADNPTLYQANLAFYLEEVARLKKAAAAMSIPQALELATPLAELEKALTERGLDRVEPNLQAVQAVLLPQNPPLSEELRAYLLARTAAAKTDRDLAAATMLAQATLATSREPESPTPPGQDLTLTRTWSPAGPPVAGWFAPPAEPADVWLLAARLEADWRQWLLDGELQRFALNPTEGDDQLAALREHAFLLLDCLDPQATPKLPPAAANSLRAALGPLVAGDSSAPRLAALQAAIPALAAAAEATAPATAAATATAPRSVDPDLLAMRDALLVAARQYRDFATGFEVAHKAAAAANGEGADWGAWRAEAEAIQAGPKLQEVAYRKWLLRHLATLHGETAASLAWTPAWHRRFAVQLLMLVNADDAFETVTYRFSGRDWKRYGAAATSAQALADRLETTAGELTQLADSALAGTPVEVDYPAIERATKTTGYLDTLHGELDLVRLFLAPDPPAAERAAAYERLVGSTLGRIAVNERRLLAAQAALAKLGALAAPSPAALLPHLNALQSALGDEAGDTGIADFAAFLADLQAMPDAVRSGPISPAQTLRLQTLRGAIADDLEARYGSVQLAPLNATRRNNVRVNSGVAVENWPIAGVIESFDRRWAERQRNAELSLLRALVACGPGPAPATDAARADLHLAYATIVEHRARQLAHERRRNSGISYLDADSGPSLSLPPHIAREFMRARNQRPPTLFKEPAEAYFQRLFKDTAQ